MLRQVFYVCNLESLPSLSKFNNAEDLHKVEDPNKSYAFILDFFSALREVVK
jgi:hypothetical protein